MTTWDVRHGDCRDVMRSLEAESVDAIVSDPPYGLAFMGKAWDTFSAGDIAMRRNPQMDAVNTGASRQGGRQRACADYQKRQARDMRAFQDVMYDVFSEALRVAKPGAHLVAFGGTRTYHRLAVAIEDAGWEVRDCLSWLYGSGFPKSHNLHDEWHGWGTALKPAWEPIILARKPLTGTVAANVTQYQTGAINVDGCRIGTDAGWSYPNGRGGSGWHGRESLSTNLAEPMQATAGRWPANVLLDEDAAGLLGEPSRFFYTAKVSRREREAGLDGMPERIAKRYGEQGQGPTEQQTPREHKPAANHHPTVKPIALMRWLCRLVTPPGGLILDPFNGSGSTGCAAVLEGFSYLGAELDAEYVEIARRRIAYWESQKAEPDLFG